MFINLCVGVEYSKLVLCIVLIYALFLGGTYLIVLDFILVATPWSLFLLLTRVYTISFQSDYSEIVKFLDVTNLLL